MAKRFFTSDWHLNSEGTRVLIPRPFRNVGRMNDVIIANANRKATSRADVIVHVGDLCQRGDDNHYRDEALRHAPSDRPEAFIDRIAATFVNLEGNHDRSNGVRSVGRSMMTSIGQFRDVSVGHYPSWHERARGTFVSHRGRKDWTIRLCGHVHGEWKHRFDPENRILNVNVGVDVWKYTIVSESEILGYVGHVSSELEVPPKGGRGRDAESRGRGSGIRDRQRDASERFPCAAE